MVFVLIHADLHIYEGLSTKQVTEIEPVGKHRVPSSASGKHQYLDPIALFQFQSNPLLPGNDFIIHHGRNTVAVRMEFPEQRSQRSIALMLVRFPIDRQTHAHASFNTQTPPMSPPDFRLTPVGRLSRGASGTLVPRQWKFLAPPMSRY